MKKYLLVCIATLCLSGTVFAQKNFEDFKRVLSPLFVDDKIVKVTEVDKTGFFEVVTEKGIFYTDKNATVLFEGILVDVKTRESLTEKSKRKLGSFVFNEINLKGAVKVVRGDGSRRIITIEDPNCGYCHRLMAELNKLTNITVYTFVTPILGDDSKSKAKSILCADNQTKVWVDFMSNPSVGVPKKECEVSFDASINLMRRLRITGTPAILFENNTIAPGIVTSNQIEEKLLKITKSKG